MNVHCLPGVHDCFGGLGEEEYSRRTDGGKNSVDDEVDVDSELSVDRQVHLEADEAGGGEGEFSYGAGESAGGGREQFCLESHYEGGDADGGDDAEADEADVHDPVLPKPEVHGEDGRGHSAPDEAEHQERLPTEGVSEEGRDEGGDAHDETHPDGDPVLAQGLGRVQRQRGQAVHVAHETQPLQDTFFTVIHIFILHKKHF